MITEVHINTNSYQFAHGKSPRGRGSWAFGTHPNQDADKLFWHNGLYTDAVKAAKEHAKKHGHGELHVMSESNEEFEAARERRRQVSVDLRSKRVKRYLDTAQKKKLAKKENTMKEDYAPIGDVITLVANDQHAEATGIVNDLLSARVLDALQDHKQDIAKALFAPGVDSLQEETEQPISSMHRVSDEEHSRLKAHLEKHYPEHKLSSAGVDKHNTLHFQVRKGDDYSRGTMPSGSNPSDRYHAEGKNWIAGAVKNKGGLHRALHVPQGEKIPAGKLEAAAKKGGKVGKEARLAKTLKGFHK